MQVVVGRYLGRQKRGDAQVRFGNILEASVVVCSGGVPRRSQPWKNHQPPTKRTLQHQQACRSSPCSLQGCRASYSGSREKPSRFIRWREIRQALLSVARNGSTSTPLRRNMGPNQPQG